MVTVYRERCRRECDSLIAALDRHNAELQALVPEGSGSVVGAVTAAWKRGPEGEDLPPAARRATEVHELGEQGELAAVVYGIRGGRAEGPSLGGPASAVAAAPRGGPSFWLGRSRGGCALEAHARVSSSMTCRFCCSGSGRRLPIRQTSTGPGWRARLVLPWLRNGSVTLWEAKPFSIASTNFTSSSHRSRRAVAERAACLRTTVLVGCGRTWFRDLRRPEGRVPYGPRAPDGAPGHGGPRQPRRPALADSRRAHVPRSRLCGPSRTQRARQCGFSASTDGISVPGLCEQVREALRRGRGSDGRRCDFLVPGRQHEGGRELGDSRRAMDHVGSLARRGR